MTYDELLAMESHLLAKVNHWQKVGRTDRVAEYMAELAEVQKRLVEFPLELAYVPAKMGEVDDLVLA